MLNTFYEKFKYMKRTSAAQAPAAFTIRGVVTGCTSPLGSCTRTESII